ncbi:NAD(P)-binding protein [Nibrella viscosa]|uniref:NAD(P)-binding protein n=1 Tax=Nibrella viscosa TaxID=1084524 RepID=A0ABP8KTF8_9BACT
MLHKTKVAVLGGGMGAMSAVYELLKADQFAGNYDITIYQMGWRIGGKGASGREKVKNSVNPSENNQRILEHGLHAWFGWYSNAFNQFKDCYTHLDWGPEHRFNTWDKAFTPEDDVVVMENIGNNWKGVPITVPAIPGEPGGHEELLTLAEYQQLLAQKLEEFFFHHPIGQKNADTSIDKNTLETFWETLKDGVDWLKEKTLHFTAGVIIRTINRLILENSSSFYQPDHPVKPQIIALIDSFANWLYTKFSEAMANDWETKKFFTLLDVGLAVTKGLIKDHVVHKGLNSINNVDFKEWLKRHGATDVTLNSFWVRTVYDSCFAYRKGIKEYPDLEAGVALRICFGIAFGSKGHWLWKMNAGMGDTIFSPYYTVLKKLGVRFEFFHKVKALTLSADKGSVSEIILERQAIVKPEYEPEGYQPTFNVGGVDCWPAAPLYDQLVEGEAMQQLAAAGKNVSLESFWSEWPGCADESKRNVVLKKRGEEGTGDFDLIILNIPIAAHIHICPELIQQNPHWLDSIVNVNTNQTFSTQLWLTKTCEQLGWKFKSSIMTAFWEPVDTFADMSHLLQAENWNLETGPKQITYLVGPFPEQPVIPPAGQHTFPDYMNAVVKDVSLDYLEKYIKWIFPGSEQGGQFAWTDLLDFGKGVGPERFNAQYWRVNVDPWERYTLSTKGSSAYRMRVDESGYSNLFFTGDWTDNGVNAGCIEACVVSGIRCATAITGTDIPVIGDNGLFQMQ